MGALRGSTQAAAASAGLPVQLRNALRRTGHVERRQRGACLRQLLGARKAHEQYVHVHVDVYVHFDFDFAFDFDFDFGFHKKLPRRVVAFTKNWRGVWWLSQKKG